MSKKEKIEFEEVTLKIPKLVMDFLRKHEKRLEEGTARAWPSKFKRV
ncbi:MAG: hypothetical protein OEW62_00330 [Candidatus Bathyarchaeota archaeon]|nr:hypothetical protein [Candidatus Bathyarchaeota archaeon]MDH5745399.1 hypothetical protein [Candidatus Bathyarchaeota archaeon]